MKFLQGKKTYLVALGAILTAVGGFLQGDYTAAEAIQQGVMALGMGTLRMGISGGAK